MKNFQEKLENAKTPKELSELSNLDLSIEELEKVEKKMKRMEFPKGEEWRLGLLTKYIKLKKAVKKAGWKEER